MSNNLDNLRALAILSVFSHHLHHVYGVPVPFFGTYGGVFGVQLFFLLSGYLIIQSAEKYSIKTYFIHRVLRIFPAYLVIFLSAGVYSGVINVDSILEHPLRFLLNISLMQHLFPQALIQFEILHVSWTLTLELIWYIIAPLLIILLQRHAHVVLMASLMISSAWASMAEHQMLDALLVGSGLPLDNIRYFYMNNAFPAQLCYFIMGAYMSTKQQWLVKIPNRVLVGFFIAVFSFLSHNLHRLTSPNFVTGLAICALFILALKSPIWSSWFLKWIADISYSLYLLHLFLLDTAKSQWHWEGTEGVLNIIVLIFCLASISYYFIEKPMMMLARRVANNSV